MLFIIFNLKFSIMKRMLAMLIALFAVLFVANAQADQSKAKETKEAKKDCIMVKDGKVWQTKDGNTAELTEDVTLTNGAVVSKDGTIKMKDGTTKTLKNSDCVYMDGKMTHMGMKKKDAKATGG